MKKPILRIPMLAIHLNRELADKGFLPNKQQHLAPILATEVQAAAAATPGQPPVSAPAPDPCVIHAASVGPGMFSCSWAIRGRAQLGASLSGCWSKSCT